MEKRFTCVYCDINFMENELCNGVAKEMGVNAEELTCRLCLLEGELEAQFDCEGYYLQEFVDKRDAVREEQAKLLNIAK